MNRIFLISKLIFMRTISKKYYLIVVNCLLLFWVVDANSQNLRIIDYVQTNNKSDVIKIYQNSKEFSSPAGEKKTEFEYSLEVNNTKIPLPPGEVFIGNSQKSIFTNYSNPTDENSEEAFLHSFRLDGNLFIPAGSVSLDHQYYSFNIVDDNIIAVDLWEGLGTKASIYNSSLNLLLEYRPFGNNGFERMISSIQGKNAAFVFFPINKLTKAKLVLIDVTTGKVIFEESVDSNIKVITRITLIDNFVLIAQHTKPENQELLCYNISGKIVWQKIGYEYAIEPIKINNKWFGFATDKNNYWFFDPANGKKTITRRFNEAIPLKSESKDIWIDVNSFGDGAGIALLVSEKEQTRSNYKHNLFIIDPNGNISNNKTIYSDSEVLKFKKFPTKLLLTDSNNQITYTYEK